MSTTTINREQIKNFFEGKKKSDLTNLTSEFAALMNISENEAFHMLHLMRIKITK